MSETTEPLRLTQFSKGAGCGCKIAPDTLQSILAGSGEQFKDDNLLVGSSTKDDAAAYSLTNGQVLISTTDFFSPIVDDPYQFGRVAATNALSDVFAMGGKPSMALAILGWPIDKLAPEHAAKVIQGGRKACSDAGIALAGGHSIDIPEPVFGLAVNGLVDRANLKLNSTMQKGDSLFLSKPLGVGILSTAMKRGVLEEEHADVALDIMCELNTIGCEVARLDGVNAMTDVTGFGLFGHLIEMCDASGVAAVLDRSAIPVLEQASYYLQKGCYPDGTFRNWRSYGSKVMGAEGNDMLLFSDPQTSGGLLISVSKESEGELISIAERNQSSLIKIGEVAPSGDLNSIVEIR